MEILFAKLLHYATKNYLISNIGLGLKYFSNVKKNFDVSIHFYGPSELALKKNLLCKYCFLIFSFIQTIAGIISPKYFKNETVLEDTLKACDNFKNKQKSV